MDLSKSLNEHWHAIMAANDKLMADFEEYILEVCPTREVLVKEDRTYIKAGRYKICTDYCFIDYKDDLFYAAVELHRNGEIVCVNQDQLLLDLLGLEMY